MSQQNQQTPMESPVATGAEAVPDRRERKRVLLVEGDGLTRLDLIRLLRQAGMNVDFASNGFIALDRFRHCCPDAILMEMHLRGVPGAELMQTVRRDPRFADKPIYVFTRQERLNRADRKAAAEQKATVIDKLSMLPEGLVAKIAAGFLEQEFNEEQPASATTSNVSSEASVPAKERVSWVITEVCRQAQELVACTEAGLRAACCRELHTRVLALCNQPAEAAMDWTMWHGRLKC